MKLELSVNLADGPYADSKVFGFEVPYGIHDEGVYEKLVDLLNTAVSWSDVMFVMCECIRSVKPDPVLKQDLQPAGELAQSQMEAQNEQQQQQQKGQE